MHNERYMSLFRNGYNQAIRIPRDSELKGTKAIIRKDGNRLIIDPDRKNGLKEILAILPTLDEDFLEITDPIIMPDDIF